MRQPEPSPRGLTIELPPGHDLTPVVRIAAQVFTASLTADDDLGERVETALVAAVERAVTAPARAGARSPVVIELVADHERLVARIKDGGGPGASPDALGPDGARELCDGIDLEHLADGARLTLWWYLHRA